MLFDHEARATFNGVRQWYRVAGARHQTIPLVLVHGGPGGNHYVFERTLGPHLETFATVVYHEQRGSGHSDPPPHPEDYSVEGLVADLEALRQHLGLERMALLGYSFGAYLALEYALTHPHAVTKLILQAPALPHDPRMVQAQLRGFCKVAEGEVKCRVEEILASKLSPRMQLERVWEIVDTPTVDRFLFESQAVAAVNRQLWADSGLTNTGDMQRALDTQALTRAAQAFGKVRAPTLLLVGRYDRNVGLDIPRDLARRLPDARLELFEHSAHFPDLEETERYASVVKQFLQHTKV